MTDWLKVLLLLGGWHGPSTSGTAISIRLNCRPTPEAGECQSVTANPHLASQDEVRQDKAPTVP